MARRNRRPPKVAGGNDLPAGFRERMAKQLGDQAEALFEALEAEAPTSIRINPFKSFTLDGAGVPWCANGRYLPDRPAFTLDPLLHAGAYYVQEASSMLIEQAIQASGIMERDALALDLCAAPGGKSTHLLSLLSPGSLLVANETVGARRSILAENLWKQGAPNAVVTGSAPTDLRAMPGAFDLILVDAPCSGEGLFRRDAFARQQWSPRLVAQCALLQQGILDDAWLALAPGGHLIYSTCTWEADENEAQVARLVALGGIPVELRIAPEWGVERVEQDGGHGYRCLPHRLRGEGFFLSMMRKDGEQPRSAAAHLGDSGQVRVPWLEQVHQTSVIEQDGTLYARPAAWASVIDGLPLRASHPGIPVAEAKGGAWMPHPAAALSILLDRSAMPAIEADPDQAIDYLRGATQPASQAQGPALLTHKGFALGWLQGAGNRWNNRWPAAWRVRQTASTAPRVSWSER